MKIFKILHIIEFLKVDFPSFVFVAFLSAGNLKTDPRLEWLPIDLTVALAGLSWLITTFAVIRPSFRFPKSFYWAIILFFLFGVPVFWTEWTPYATEKVSRLFTLTLSAALLPVLLFRNKDDLRKIFNSFAIVSLFIIFNNLYSLILGYEDRISATGVLEYEYEARVANKDAPIAVGRLGGMGALWLALLVESGERSAALLLLIGPMVLVMIGTGSRGPLLGFIVAMGIQSAMYSFNKKCSRNNALILYGFLFAAFLVGLMMAPGDSSDRIQLVLNGEKGTSGEARTDAYVLSLMQIGRCPLGLGWGGFADLPDYTHHPSGRLLYPHNIYIEITLECGWICGLYFISIILISIYLNININNNLKSIEYRALLSMMIFQIINCGFSGDINDSRVFISMLMIGLNNHRPPAGGFDSRLKVRTDCRLDGE